MYDPSAESQRLHRLDRLYVVALAVLTVVGCDSGGEAADEESSAGGRVNAVQAEEEPPAPPEAFCDTYRSGSEAPAFEYPPLRGEAPGEPDGWRWVNVWATWCKPCIEEMPRLVEWQNELADDGLSRLTLISVDEKRETVEKFRSEHPETPESLLIEQPDAVKEWLEAMGSSAGAPLPVHVFVDPAGKVRCLRAGGVGEDEFAEVERLLDV